jgi:hypothetical protein
VKERKATRRRHEQRVGEAERAVLRDLRRRVEESEKEVAVLERRVKELTAFLEDPALYTTREGTERAIQAGKQLDETRRQLDVAIEVWTTATERAESAVT